MYNEYMEDGHSKAAKKRIKARKDHIEKRMLDSMNFKKTGSNANGYCGTIKIGDGPETSLVVLNKNKNTSRRIKDGPYFTTYLDEENKKIDGFICMPRSLTRIKGSDLADGHEYGHAIDSSENLDKISNSDIDEEKYKKFIDNNRNIRKTSKSNKKIIKKNNKKFGTKINDHDRQDNEIRADAYTISNVKGNNNANRFRKNLNETYRRQQQSKNSKIDSYYIDKIEDKKKEISNLDDDTDNKKFLKKIYLKNLNNLENRNNKRKDNIHKKYNKIKSQNKARIANAEDYTKLNKK